LVALFLSFFSFLLAMRNRISCIMGKNLRVFLCVSFVGV
jgi:hypothetical protein